VRSLATDWILHLLFAGVVATLCGCGTIGRIAVDRVGDALTSGGSTFSSDDDPDLVREAVPFGLKTYESLLAVSPKHRGLLLAAASGFSAYAYLLEQHAEVDDLDAASARRLHERAKGLFLRGRDYALRGLALDHPALPSTLTADPARALAVTQKSDVPFLYWTSIGWAGAIAAAKDDAQLIAELPIAAAAMARVLALDEPFDRGSAHEFFVTYEGSRPGGDVAAARAHYARALALSAGERASLHLALAESVAVHEQNEAEFRALLARALAVDTDAVPELRVVNRLAQRRAAWLTTQMPFLFIGAEETK